MGSWEPRGQCGKEDGGVNGVDADRSGLKRAEEGKRRKGTGPSQGRTGAYKRKQREQAKARGWQGPRQREPGM